MTDRTNKPKQAAGCWFCRPVTIAGAKWVDVCPRCEGKIFTHTFIPRRQIEEFEFPDGTVVPADSVEQCLSVNEDGEITVTLEATTNGGDER